MELLSLDDARIGAFLVGAAVATFVTAAVLFRRAAHIRASALAASRATIRGQVAEQLVPLHAAFPFEPGDARFLGGPIDYVVFEGLSDGEDELEIVFVEVKTGRGRLTAREAAIRRAVEDGRVRFELVRLE